MPSITLGQPRAALVTACRLPNKSSCALAPPGTSQTWRRRAAGHIHHAGDTGDLFRVILLDGRDVRVPFVSQRTEKEVTFRKCQFAPAGSTCPVMAALVTACLDRHSSPEVNTPVEGSRRNFYDCSSGALDVGIQLWRRRLSMPVDVHSCYWESTQRPLSAQSYLCAASNQPVRQRHRSNQHGTSSV